MNKIVLPDWMSSASESPKNLAVHSKMLERIAQYTTMASRGLRMGMNFENPTFVSVCITPNYWHDLMLNNTEHGTTSEDYRHAAIRAAELLAVAWYSVQTIWYVDSYGGIIGEGIAILGGSSVQRENIIMLSNSNTFVVVKGNDREGVPDFAGELIESLQIQTDTLNNVCIAVAEARNKNIRITNHLLSMI